MLHWVANSDGREDNLHRTGEKTNPNRCGTVFFVNPQNLEANYFWVFGTVELENSL